MSHNSRLGLRLFAIYLLLYLGFVLLNTFSAATMESTPIAGLSLAILYGFGLIFAAFLLAMIYGVLCGKEDGKASAPTTKKTVQ